MKHAKTPTHPDPHGLTLPQQSAVDLLASGKNDSETAAALGLHRVSITRWRLYSAEFRAALNARRAAIWGASADRLRALLPRALDALADALENADDKLNVALAVLKLAGPLPVVPSEPTVSEDIMLAKVERERERIRTTRDDAIDRLNGLPPYSEHVETVRKRLARLAGPPEGEPTLRTQA
ncbi:MAG: hypothetical protein U0792_02490 [Gemmataceae bacterium]